VTSTTSKTIATGSFAFTVSNSSTDTIFSVGQRVRIASQANTSNWMEGPITVYSGTSMTVVVDLINGSGTAADWIVVLTGQPATLGGTLTSNLNTGAYAIISTSGANIPITPDSTGQVVITNANLTSASNGNITITPNGTGLVNITNTKLNTFREVVYAIGSAGGAQTPNISLGSIQTITLTSNLTFSSITNIAAGQSFVLIVTQDGTGSRTLTSTMKFSGGTKTLSTAAGSIDVIGVFYDGATYYANLSKGYA
jgi:hypothetical protein